MIVPYPCNKSKHQSGLTYVELLVVLGMIAIIFSTVLLIINPSQLKAKARDNKRLSDLSVLERMVSEYALDAGSYPGSVDTVMYSNAVPSGNSGPVESASSGWIDANLVEYNPSLPIDPVNDSTYRYSYKHTDTGFEINAELEFDEYITDYAQNDAGNSSTTYEVGNDLTIL